MKALLAARGLRAVLEGIALYSRVDLEGGARSLQAVREGAVVRCLRAICVSLGARLERSCTMAEGRSGLPLSLLSKVSAFPSKVVG